MALSVRLYVAALALVGLLRLAELAVSRRNQRRMKSQGVSKIAEPWFHWMVVLHVGVLISAAAEVIVLHRPLIPALAAVMSILVVLATALRWWVIRVMAEHWNVQVMASTRLGIVQRGPYRYIRHPNYVAVFTELLALPLIHAAWLTALFGSLANVWLLRKRIRTEEAMLMADPQYAIAMGRKPRFIPRLT